VGRVTDSAAADEPDERGHAHEPERSRRRTALVVGTVAAVLAVVVAIVVVLGTRSDGVAYSEPGLAPHFVDDTATSGVDHVYDGDFDFFVGGGVATFDCDDDGFSDLYVAGGTDPAALYRNRSEVGGELRFEQVESPVTDLDRVTGAYPIDVDGDSIVDLAVLRNGSNVMLRGTGDCTFEDATETWGIDPGDDWTVAFSATWTPGDRLPTMAFGSYLADDRESCADSVLVRPNTSSADGAEVAGFGPAEPLSPGYCTLSALFSDWSRTGERDLRLTNDRHYYHRDGSEQMWRIVPGVPPRLYDEQDGWLPLQIWGMGIASQDLTGDGRPEVFLTSQGDNKLQSLDEGATGPTYRDIALRRDATVQRPYAGGDVLPSTAWHPEFADVNDDGFVDLLVTKGNVEAQTDHAMRDPSNLLIGQPDGTFVEGAEDAGIVRYEPSRGASVTDLNLDGMLDMVIVHRRSPVTLWRNVGSGTDDAPVRMGRSVAVRVRDAAPNTDAIGAWVEVRVDDRTIQREITIGGGHGSGELGWIHLGLGAADRADIRVQWPDGEVGPWMEVGDDPFVEIRRGDDEPTPWNPGP